MPTGQFVKVVVPLYYEGHAFRAGSRIRVTIASPNGTQPVWSFSQTQPDADRNRLDRLLHVHAVEPRASRRSRRERADAAPAVPEPAQRAVPALPADREQHESMIGLGGGRQVGAYTEQADRTVGVDSLEQADRCRCDDGRVRRGLGELHLAGAGEE